MNGLLIGLYFSMPTIVFAASRSEYINKAAVGALGGIMLLIVWFLLQFLNRFEQPGQLPIDEEGYTELMRLATDGDVEGIRSLLTSGCDIDAVDSNGATALMYAAQAACLDVIELLLASGANKKIRSKTGHTAYQYADSFQGERHAKAASMLK